MNKKTKILIGIILITIGIGQVSLVTLNKDEILWEHRGQFLDYEGSIIQKIPPNPILGNLFIIRVSADFYNLYYMHYSNSGNISFTHQESGRIFEFEYYLSQAEGDFDYEEKRWSLPSGTYNLSWVNLNCAYMYKLIKVGIGYPYNNVVVISSIVINTIFAISGIGLISVAMGFIRTHRKFNRI